jgi:hypothetical protein
MDIVENSARYGCRRARPAPYALPSLRAEGEAMINIFCDVAAGTGTTDQSRSSHARPAGSAGTSELQQKLFLD